MLSYLSTSLSLNRPCIIIVSKTQVSYRALGSIRIFSYIKIIPAKRLCSKISYSSLISYYLLRPGKHKSFFWYSAMRTSKFTELLDAFPQVTSPSSNVSLDDILAETAYLSYRLSSVSDGDNNDALRLLREPRPRRRLRKTSQSRRDRTE